MDIEFVSLVQAERPDAYQATYDVIYAGETWCRSVVTVAAEVAAVCAFEETSIIRAARDALLELLTSEAVPVSFHLRLTVEGTTVLERANPGK